MKHPVYYKDILKHIRTENGVMGCVKTISFDLVGVSQAFARAGDEIEKLRRENKRLKKYEKLYKSLSSKH